MTAHPPVAVEAAAAPRRRMRWHQRLLRDRVLVLVALPGVVSLLVFHYLPWLGNVIAFKDYQPYIGILESPWVGLNNFRVIWEGDPGFLNALSNTLIITLLQVLIVFPAPIALALLLDSLISQRLKKVVQSILYLPHFLSWVIVVAIFQQMFGNAGLLNSFLRTHDLATVSIITNPELFKLLVTSQVLWKDAGWATILFLAALARIDVELYEASAVDGAGRWRQLWHVTLPGLRSLIVLLLILRLGDSLTVGFEQIILQEPAVGRQVSEVLDTYVFNHAILAADWGQGAAVGLVKGLVGVLLVLGANRLAHRLGERGIYSR
ncbi:polysaccharide ABC transporter ATP-binding protein [Catellatospora sp. IY07-71]|uniref:ABC transporter permease n=1 Tax=Catellatospora sp. IY07-71 TaxID=2728827 RepID=UPI001BB3C4A8|nr:ABC transporter permease subunit [Catellatospora sp. IY07-71]BCJ70972.1 polysaccharide ABC transporter ATP-binding protein [Catellatospora sp. IY07-71]